MRSSLLQPRLWLILLTMALGIRRLCPDVAVAQEGSNGVDTPAAADSVAHVWLMLAPGTIQTYPADRLNYQRYKGAPELSGEEMLQKIPEVTRFARVSVDSQGSWEYDTPEQLRALTMRINEILARPDVDGLVLAHGTNEIEETAYWLDPDRIQQMFDEY